LVLQADFLELKLHKLIFINFGAAGKIIYNIDTASTNFRMNFAEQKKDRKNEIGDLGPPKSRVPLAVAQIAIP
jgi:hypothetical protein